MVELVTVSLRIPREMNLALERYVEGHGYASKTEVLREWLRSLLYENAEVLKGALKGRVKPSGQPGAWRRKEWKNALKEAGGDARKAVALLDKREKKAISGLRF